MLTSPNNSEIMTSVGAEHTGYAGSFVGTARHLANCFGTAAAAGTFTVLRNGFEHNMDAVAANVSAFRWIVIAMGCITCISLIACLRLKNVWK